MSQRGSSQSACYPIFRVPPCCPWLKILGSFLTTESTDRHGTNCNGWKNLIHFHLGFGCETDEPTRIQPERVLSHFPCPSVLSVVKGFILTVPLDWAR